MSQLQVNQINDASGGVLAPISSVMRNRIINGAMVIDQRNAGASITITTANQYTLDRWQAFNTQSSKFSVQRNAGSVTPPAGFTNYLGATSSSSYSVLSGDIFGMAQVIEGFNMADLGWGTANAQTITLSFWVRSSLTGTFGGSLVNGTFNYSYPFSYTISSANTWEQKSVTIAGATAGTWVGAVNTAGIYVVFGLGGGASSSGTAGAWTANGFSTATGATSVVGTNGATFYITGVQLEKGTQATGFEYRQYQQELALCQRYYNIWSGANSPNVGLCTILSNGGTSPFARRATWSNPVDFRARPTLGTGGSIQIYNTGLTNFVFAGFNGNQSNKNIISFDLNSSSGGTNNQMYWMIIDSSSAANYIDASAEL